MENRGDNQNEKEKNASFVVKIPSYEEVVESSQPKSKSFFNPSTSFSQAFNFIKDSEFYTTPPPASSSSSSQLPKEGSSSSSQGPNLSRGIIQSEVPSTSVSSAGANRNAILVSHRQKGNLLLKHIRNVRWVFADIVSDYILGQNSCALYLSLRYHLLHPDYLYFRIRELQKNFKLRIILCHVDVEDVVKPLLEVTKTALLHDCTLLCSWSLEECGRYLETIKVYENKPADLIQGQMDMDYMSRLNHAITSLRHVNKTDVVTLGSTFGSLSSIMDSSMEDLARCPGIGEKKVKRLHDTFHEQFKRVTPIPAAHAAENPVDNTVSEKERNEGVTENKEKTEHQEHKNKKEEETSVKSALKAAFAKYSGKRKAVVQNERGEKDDSAQRASNSEDVAR